MKRFLIIGLMATALVGCGEYNPLTNPKPAPNPNLLPGTDAPTSGRAIQRYEEEDSTGNGYAQSISYDANADTFSVDNLAFDANNVYARDNVVPNLGGPAASPFRVYENAAIYQDDVTGAPINQFPHKAIYGESATGRTRFAIVRTGAYIPYGFGGFMYQRDDGVVLPANGQAALVGNYAGLRDFDNRGGLEYVTGDMQVDIDFRDFNKGRGVKGSVTNRQIFDLNGANISGGLTTALGVANLPVLLFVVGPGVSDNNGEVTGGVVSSYLNAGGAVQVFEEGKYYAVLSGSGADMEMTGVIVATADDPRYSGVTVRETGGFILYR